MPQLSIVIAAYNEENRLPGTLARIESYLRTHAISYEFVIVNDGSNDNTLEWLNSYAISHPQVRILTHSPNQGRGASIRKGVLSAQGRYVLETDADGSVDDEAITRFLSYFDNNPTTDLLIGSRNLKGSAMPVQQPFLRIVLGWGFIYLSRLTFGMWHISDFTLGFKMMRHATSQAIFAVQKDNYFVAEAEIIYIAHLQGRSITELPVNWSDDRDSRVRAVRDSIRSLIGMAKVRAHFIRSKLR